MILHYLLEVTLGWNKEFKVSEPQDITIDLGYVSANQLAEFLKLIHKVEGVTEHRIYETLRQRLSSGWHIHNRRQKYEDCP